MSESRITKLHIKIDAYVPIFEQLKLIPDEEWTKANIKEPISFKLELSDSTELCDEKGRISSTLQQLANSLVPREHKELPPTRKTHVFDKPTFIKTKDSSIPKLKIKAIEVVISKRLSQVEME